MPAETEEETEETLQPKGIQPFEPEDLGLYAPFEMSPESMYGPEQLGPDIVSAIKGMIDGSGKYEDAARTWEVIQATEARLFDRGYQWLTNAKNGGSWTVAGTGGTGGVGAGAIATQDRGKMWSVNIYGARKDKIVAALTVKDPQPEFFPKDPAATATDGRFAEESNKYKHLWKQATNVRNLCVKIGGLFYTDDRVGLITETIADKQRFGMDGGKPGMQEVTRACGKLELRVPMSIDEDESLPWCCRERELDLAIAKEKYSWIAGKIQSGAGAAGQIGRTCRLTVRNAVSGEGAGGVSSQSTDRAVTEATWWVQPSQYRDVVDEGIRKQLREMFEDGLRIVLCGGEFAYCRNEKMDDCVIILYSREGTGQNRRAIGTNNLTTQKVLNYDFSLFNRYMTACVPRKLHMVSAISSEAINQQRGDPAYSMPVDEEKVQMAGGIQGVTGIEQVPSPPAQLLDFIQSMTEGLPEILDGASPSMFGGTDGTDTVGGITIQRDQALQVFGTPYNAMTWGIAISCGNAAKWAGKNRQGKASGMVPGVGRISVDFGALANGDAYCFPEADSGFPESEAEKEQRLMEAVDSAGSVPIFAQSLNDPSNFEALNKVTKRFGMSIVGTDSVRKQQEEFEFILKQPAADNPALVQAQGQLQQLAEQAKTEPDAQTPQGQQALQQAVAAVGQIPAKVCTVPVEQDASVNHGIEASTCFTKINSAEGQKLKREKPDVFENLMLHWQGHVDMAQKLAPPPASPEVKPSVSIAVDKLGPEAQAQVLQKEYGITVTPEQTQPSPDVHEVIQEKEGVDESGVPTKQKISYSGKELQ